MISKDAIVKLAKINNVRAWQQEKHYLQAVMLATLAEYPLVFKGGTYLWFFHELPRFSEDLDFTSQGTIPENLAEDVSDSLSLFGIQNKIKILKKDRFINSFKFACEGPLHTTEKDVSHVYVEISSRDEVKHETQSHTFEHAGYNLPVKIIQGMALVEVAAEKVRAIFTRDKARDLYDLAYLIAEKNTPFDRELVNSKLDFYNQTYKYSLFEAKIAEKKQYWSGELQQLLARSLTPFGEVKNSVLDWAEKTK
ncbi:MAG: nucleotidyl transferase AbiEii/AbiGii toxin family protein [Candidatus Altiarchaeota archaeon]